MLGVGAQNGVGDIENSIFEENAAKFGGAVFRGTSTSNLAGCTFEGNQAKTSGSDIYDSHVEVPALAECSPVWCSCLGQPRP